MASVKLLTLATALAVFAFEEVAGLKCWSCSTDAVDGSFCKDLFDPDKLTPEEIKMSYEECRNSTTPGVEGVCKKLEQRIKDKIVIQRGCYYQDANDVSDKCVRDATPWDVRTIFCATCKGDGCNSANTSFCPFVLLLFSLCLIFQTIL